MSTYKESVIYQIYPRSFADSNGDGIGDLQGIISKLDYLAELGVDVLWLSPIFQSPNADNGYDVSDYEAIIPEFGTMADFDDLLAGAHQRGLKLILDLVVNHSSDEHRWFQESRRSKTNPYRDYYIWKTPRPNGSPPNNWQSFFSGPAWKLDEPTGEYYLHLFAEKQPDLNWEHEPLRQEIYQMMRFWLEKGVDGFRMDVIPFLSKDQTFPDYPEGRFGDLTIYANGPRIHEFLQEMHRATIGHDVLAHYTAFDGSPLLTIGEGFGVAASQANLYVGANRRELGMIYHFDHAVPREEHRFLDPAPELTLPELKAIFANWNTALDSDTNVPEPAGAGWQNVYFGNHDNPRVLSRFGDPGTFRYESGTLLATVLLTQRGTPGIYQGDELGMSNCPFTTINEFDDIQVKNAYRELVEKGGGSPAKFLAVANRIARDHARTPMQWANVPGAGFTTGTPWLKINPSVEHVNVLAQQQTPKSVLAYYQRLLRWRRQTPAMHHGTYRDLLPDHPAIWAFERVLDGVRYVTIANFSGNPTVLPLRLSGTTVLGNYSTVADDLRPWEARIIGTD